MQVADCLKKHNVDINCVNIYTYSPLLGSAGNNIKYFPALTEKLLTLGANVNHVNRYGDNFVGVVIDKGNSKQDVR